MSYTEIKCIKAFLHFSRGKKTDDTNLLFYFTVTLVLFSLGWSPYMENFFSQAPPALLLKSLKFLFQMLLEGMTSLF